MKNWFWLFVFLLSIFLSEVHSQCSKIHPSDETEGVGAFECTDSNCWIKIDPNPTLGAFLYLKKNENKLKVFVTSSLENSTELLQRELNNTADKSYLAGPNQGFTVVWSVEECNEHRPAPLYSFSRHTRDSHICGPILHFIGHEIETIQNGYKIKRKFEDSCRYHLVRSPKDRSIPETLYLRSDETEGFKVNSYGNQEHNSKNSMVIIKNWTSVDFAKNYKGSSSNHLDTDSFTAVSTATSCSCMVHRVELSGENMVFLKSPGFPNFHCPSAQCETQVSFPRENSTDNFLHRVLITLETTSYSGVQLSLSSGTVDVGFNKYLYSHIATNFLLDQNELKIEYTTSNFLYLGPKGHFSMAIQNVKIKKACECSLFNQRVYTDNKLKVKVVIPDECDLMFCDWALKGNEDHGKELTINVEHAIDNDEIHIWNSAFMEKYDSFQLRYPRKVYLPKGKETHIFFRRNSSSLETGALNASTVVTISWILEPDGGYARHNKFSLSNSPLVFTTPEYPLDYSFADHFTTRLIAPHDHYVHLVLNDFDVDNIHDHLSIYDGNSSSSVLLAYLTGIKGNLTVLSSGETMLVDFLSDGFHGRRGYHFVAFAVPNVPKNRLLEIIGNPTASAINLVENATTNSPYFSHDLEFDNYTLPETDLLKSCDVTPQGHGILFFLGIALGTVLILSGVIIIGKIYWHKKKDANKAPSFVNETVRLRNLDNESTATVETDS